MRILPNSAVPAKFEDLKDKIFTEIKVIKDGENDCIIFKNKYESYYMLHTFDCCEDVYIENICGDILNLINSPILMAEEETNTADIDIYKHVTWTFYKLATVKDYVTIRWYGCSNGYYSEEVDIFKVTDIES